MIAAFQAAEQGSIPWMRIIFELAIDFWRLLNIEVWFHPQVRCVFSSGNQMDEFYPAACVLQKIAKS